MVDLERLRTFYVATKTGKFNIAAEELGLDSSSITRQIQSLERELDCTLFERGGFRGLRLTEKGKILQGIAHRLFATVAEITPSLSRADTDLEGPLKIWIHGGYSLKFVSAHIDEFIEKYPKITFEIVTSQGIMDVAIREVDIAIGPDIEITEGLIDRELLSYHLKLYANKKYIDTYGEPKEADDLKNHRIISATSSSPKFFPKANWYLNLTPDMALEPYFISNSNVFIETLIKKGVGIGSLSPFFVNKDENMVEILPHILGPELTISMVYGEHFKTSKKIEALYKFLLGKINLTLLKNL
jgi:DNA-binding transcriptional LysR family regulator